MSERSPVTKTCLICGAVALKKVMIHSKFTDTYYCSSIDLCAKRAKRAIRKAVGKKK